MPRFRNALLLWFCTSLLAAHSHAAESTVRIVPLAELGVDVELGPPVVVAVSAPDETRWGHHQFPKLSALPKGEILLTYNAGADDNAAYGHPGPAYVSRDGGTTWQKYAGEPALAISHSPVSDLPPLNGTTSRAIIWWCHNQRRAFHATRKERTGHP